MTTEAGRAPRHSAECFAIGGGPGHDTCVCRCHGTASAAAPAIPSALTVMDRIDGAMLPGLRRVAAIYAAESPGGWTPKGWGAFTVAALDFFLAHSDELLSELHWSPDEGRYVRSRAALPAKLAAKVRDIRKREVRSGGEPGLDSTDAWIAGVLDEVLAIIEEPAP